MPIEQSRHHVDDRAIISYLGSLYNGGTFGRGDADRLRERLHELLYCCRMNEQRRIKKSGWVSPAKAHGLIRSADYYKRRAKELESSYDACRNTNRILNEEIHKMNMRARELGVDLTCNTR